MSNYAISKVTSDDGLSQGSNYFRFEDSRGFMWLTCNDAVNRFDGKTVKVYNLNRYFMNCPVLQQGYGFAEDLDGNIYIGSVRGLYIYNRKTDTFSLQRIFKNQVDDVAMPVAFIDGKIWCFNKEFRLATYDIKTKKITFITQLDLKPFASVHIYELRGNIFYYHYPTVDSQGNLWFISNNEILKFNTATLQSQKPIRDYCSKNDVIFLSSTYDKFTNRLLLGTYNSFLEFDIVSNKLTALFKIDNNKLKMISGIACNSNYIVIESEDNDLILINKHNQVKTVIGKTATIRSFNNLAFDKSNRLWFCDDSRGQVIIDFSPPLMNKVTSETYPNEYTMKVGVGSFGELPNKSLVVAPFFLFEKNKQHLEVYKNSQFEKGYIVSSDKYNNGVWLYRLNIYDNPPQKEIDFLTDKNKITTVITEKSPNGDEQKDLQVLSKNNILCSFASGLYWLNAKEKTLEKVKNNNASNPFKINVLSNGYIAVSYLNSDMILYQLLPNRQLRFIRKILPKVQSFYMQQDNKSHHYWVGTNQGVYLLDKDFNTIKIFDANNGLAGTYIYGLLLDDAGNAFCSHQRGLSAINAKSFKVINYNKKDGIQDWDFNNRAFYKASDGTLYFGGSNGFNYFKPPLIHKAYYKPEVYIDAILVNDKEYNSVLCSNNTPKINLNYNQNNIVIKAFVKDLTYASSLELIYRIKEIDNKAQHLTNGVPINFNNLAPNKYTLQLGYYDKYSGSEVFQKTLFIAISPPFYNRIWFWFLVSFSITGFIFWIFNRRKFAKQKQIFQQKLALQQQRNKITADLHDDIGATLSSLQINSAVANKLIGKNPAEAQKVLEKIENQSQILGDKIGDIIWSMKPGKDEFMTMSTRIKNFANEILGATHIQYTIQIDTLLDAVVTDITTRKNIVLLIKEAVNNAAKYSQASTLSIKIFFKNNSIHIIIVDNGIGFDSNQMKGNGLHNMKTRTEELNGIFSIISQPKMGTTITAIIPVVP